MLSEDARQIIRNMYQTFQSYKKVARIARVSDKTVRNIILDEYVKDKKKPGPKPEITQSEERAIIREINKLIMAGSRVTAPQIQAAAGLQRLSTRTVQNKLKKMSYVYRLSTWRIKKPKSKS